EAADAIAMMPITEEDLERARNNRLKNIENTMNNTINFGIALTEFVGAGDWRLWFLHRDRMEKLTVDDLKRVAAKYYKPSNRTYGVFVPDAAPDRTVVAERPDVAKMLDGYKGKEAAVQKENFENTIENIKQHTEYGNFPNGARYALLQKPTKGDKISASISMRWGDEKSLM